MAYRITYQWDREKKLMKTRKLSFGTVLSLTAVATAVAIRLLVPQSAEVFRQLLYPLMDEFTIVALGEMVGQIGDGTPMGEAVTAFCREIIINGG